MGFNLEMFFMELLLILDSEVKDTKKVKFLKQLIYSNHQYAIDCGLIEQASRNKNGY